MGVSSPLCGGLLFYVHAMREPDHSKCPICFALTDEPDQHKQWHVLHAQNLKSLIDAVGKLKPPPTPHRRR